MSGGAMRREPLYLLLEKYGHTTAHEISKTLAHKALELGKPLYEIASQDAGLADYLAKFTDSEKQILQTPEKHYTGLASQKALAVIDRWQALLDN